jgi:hypothetical protein
LFFYNGFTISQNKLVIDCASFLTCQARPVAV